MAVETFNDRVAARTRAAAQIVAQPDLLAVFLSVAGTKEDLEAIRDHGLRAQILNQAKSSARGSKEAATLELLKEISEVHSEYLIIMNAVRAERGAQIEAQAPESVIKKIDDVIENRAQVSERVATLEDGTTLKLRKPSEAQEAVRAEIVRDMQLLMTLTEIHPALANRQVTVERMQRLHDRAQAIAEKLATRAELAGTTTDRKKAEAEAVRMQSVRWSASYGTLQLAARRSAAIAKLLKEASRAKATRTAKKKA